MHTRHRYQTAIRRCLALGILAALSLGVALLGGCDSGVVEEDEEYFYAWKNGVGWAANYFIANRGIRVSSIITAHIGNRETGQCPPSGCESLFMQVRPAIRGEGTYTLDSEAYFSYIAGDGELYRPLEPFEVHITDVAPTGAPIVTEWLTGTFEMTLVNTNNPADVLRFTDGHFRMGHAP